MKKTFLAMACTLGMCSAHAIDISSADQQYLQNFDSLATSGTAVAWANDSTLAGWSLFNRNAAPIATYAANNGSSNTGAFISFGSTGSSERALGGVASGGAYFGSPAAGTLAGWIAASFTNTSGVAFDSFTVGFDGEQWRNGGNASTQTLALEYGFGGSFGSVANWTAPGGSFDFSSPVTGTTAAALDGNAAGLLAGLGGSVATTWNSGDTLWLRWVENNDPGNDHGLAIDNFSLSVTAVPEPGSIALMLAGLGVVGFVARRRG